MRKYLIDSGVAPERLQAIGTGEAKLRNDDTDASRRVQFLVLIWNDEDEDLPVMPIEK